jgi:hypothetical protein
MAGLCSIAVGSSVVEEEMNTTYVKDSNDYTVFWGE